MPAMACSTYWLRARACIIQPGGVTFWVRRIEHQRYQGTMYYARGQIEATLQRGEIQYPS